MRELDFDNISQSVIDEHLTLEVELLILLIKHLQQYEDLEGDGEWYAKQLLQLGAMNQQMVQIVSKHTKLSLKQTESMLQNVVSVTVDFQLLNKAYKEGLLKKSPDKLHLEPIFNRTHESIKTDLELTGDVVVKETNKMYREAITKVHTEVHLGNKGYEQAIRETVENFGKQGITGATYKRGGQTVNYSLEGVVRRDVINAVSNFANEVQDEIIDELGGDYVYVSEHTGARSRHSDHRNHAQWQGKVYSLHGDDVKYKDFIKETGAGLVDGFGGINCRHIKYAFFPDIQEEPKPRVDRELNDKVYELTQTQRRYERQVRNGLRELKVAEASGDEELIKRKKQLLASRRKRLRTFVKDNNKYLKRYYEREKI